MSLAIAMKVSSGERRKFIVLFMDSVQIYRVALFANMRKVTASECQVKKLGHSENLLTGTVFFMFLIYLKAIYDQKMKEIHFSTTAMKSRFC